MASPLVHVVARPSDAPQRDQLGEGAFWDQATGALYWVDIVGKRAMRLDPLSGAMQVWPTPSPCSAIIPTARGDAIVALADGLHRLNFETGAIQHFCSPDPDVRNRSNDCRTDARGRIWLGTMWNNIGENGEGVALGGATGTISCVEADGSSTRMLTDMSITNSIAFSPDGRTFYCTDTRKHLIWAFACDPDGPTLSNQRVFSEVTEGGPDGSSVDVEGGLWTAQWGAGKVVRRTPDGRTDREIVVPAHQPSSCCFGGPDLKTLYITSARQDLAALEPSSLDGALFAVDLDTAGLPMTRFAG